MFCTSFKQLCVSLGAVLTFLVAKPVSQHVAEKIWTTTSKAERSFGREGLYYLLFLHVVSVIYQQFIKNDLPAATIMHKGVTIMAPWQQFWSGGFWVFPIIMMTFMLVIVIVVLFVMRSFWGRGFRPPWLSREREHYDQMDSPLEIAKGRYARGEITKEEFEEIAKTIS
jgi:putative membrane protein